MIKGIEKYRYERKYVIENKLNFLIKDFIKNNQLMFFKEYENRTVNTIYFDNSNLDFYNQNLNGLYNREKIRIRWYSEQLKIIKPILELKIKKGNLGKKLLYNLPSINNNQEPFVSVMNSLYKNNLNKFIKEKICRYRANSFISYKREYFVSRQTNCRLTLDSDIRFYNVFANKLNKRYQKYERNILEIKFAANEDSLLIDGLSDLPLRNYRHSKYVECLNMIR